MKLNVTILLVILIFSCNSTTERTTTSGMKYSVLKAGQGDVPEDGEFLLLNIKWVDNNDSTWGNSADSGYPMPIPKSDSIWQTKAGSIEQVFGQMKVGDSVQFTVSIEEFFSKTVQQPPPPNVDVAGSLTFSACLTDALDKPSFDNWQEEIRAKQQAEAANKAEEQLKSDIITIDEYLTTNSIDAQETESGLRYVITQQGNGTRPESGQTVKVNYIGNVLNGEVFDTNIKELAESNGLYDARREPYGPFEFPLGLGRVIRGWDEGIGLLDVGGKATYYIPSTLAYGPGQRGEIILPNSILVFDVELLEIVSQDQAPGQ